MEHMCGGHCLNFLVLLVENGGNLVMAGHCCDEFVHCVHFNNAIHHHMSCTLCVCWIESVEPHNVVMW